MMRPPESWGETILLRMDRWSERSKWLPTPEQRFPSNVFWGIFVWNFPILLVAIGAIGTLLYRSDKTDTGFFFDNWILEVFLVALTLATTIDFFGCLWLRRLWNRRARWLREG